MFTLFIAFLVWYVWIQRAQIREDVIVWRTKFKWKMEDWRESRSKR